MKLKSKLICIIVVISTVFIFIMLILITKPVSKVKLIASDGENFDSFGGSVSISDNYAIVGSYFDDDKGEASGSAYVFKKDQENANRWIEVKKITAIDGDEFDSFGLPVDIEGDYAVVGAWLGGKSKADGVYIFKKDHGGKDNWGELKQLTAGDNDKIDYFGISISISGDYIMVGSGKSYDSGPVHVYKKNQGGTDNWGEIKRLTASDGTEYNNFGHSLYISGDYAVIGSSGAAYIFKKDYGGKDNWGEIKKLTASDDASDENFGSSISIYHDYVIVGNSWDNDRGKSSGSAYIFKKDYGGKDNWGEIKKLTASDGGKYNYFGKSISIYGNYIIVGASNNSSDGDPGSAYIFKKNKGGADKWGQVKKLTADERVAGDYYGCSVSMSGDYAIVGALNDNGEDSGAVYIYRFK